MTTPAERPDPLRSVAIEIIVRVCHLTQKRRVRSREKRVGWYDAESEQGAALIAARYAMNDLIQEEKEEQERIARNKEARASKPKRKPTRKERWLAEAKLPLKGGEE